MRFPPSIYGLLFAWLCASGVLLDIVEVFAFVQVPVYQRVNGLQLMPECLFSVGLRYKL